MEINKFQKLKSNKYKVYIDNTYITLYDDIIIKYNLLVNKKIDTALLNEIIKENDSLDAYYLSLKYIARKLRCKNEVIKYLESKGYDSKVISFTIDRLTNNGLFNESIYVESYINDQINFTLNGPIKITNNLISLGFNKNIIEEYLIRHNDAWETKINKYIAKKCKSNHKYSEYDLKRRIREELINLGYDSSIISDYINSISITDDVTFNKNANKIYNKYKSKYNNQELQYKFRAKMYSLGYSNELINAYLQENEEVE
mgnify:FL=1